MKRSIIGTETFTVASCKITVGYKDVMIGSSVDESRQVILGPRDRKEAAQFAVALRFASKRMDHIAKLMAAGEAE